MSLVSGNLRGQVPIPYATSNAALAITLYICGVPFTQSDGVTFPGFNLYSNGFLKERGYEGKKPDAAIAELWQKGIPGNIVYQFEKTPILDEIAAGWDEMAEAIKNADTANPGAMTAMPTGAIEARDVANICCQFTKTRHFFFGDKQTEPLWRRRDQRGNLFVPACKASDGSHTSRDGEKIIVMGSMKLKSVKV